MVKDIAIYIEGGGDTAATIVPFRQGFSAFLKPVVDALRERRIHWRLIPCGGRKQAYDAFVDALDNEPAVFNVLLVDAEEPIKMTQSPEPWKHVKQRQGDQWERPHGADDNHLQLMTACMEAWFLADPEGLRKHFGGKFDGKKLPAANLAESRTKDVINNALKHATKNTPAGEYRKIRDGAKLLETVDSENVRRYCRWCERLFCVLNKVIEV